MFLNIEKAKLKKNKTRNTKRMHHGKVLVLFWPLIV